jgi:hypothetical protein
MPAALPMPRAMQGEVLPTTPSGQFNRPAITSAHMNVLNCPMLGDRG